MAFEHYHYDYREMLLRQQRGVLTLTLQDDRGRWYPHWRLNEQTRAYAVFVLGVLIGAVRR